MTQTELRLRERRTIEDVLNAKMSVNKIASEIGSHSSTVFREIRRNGYVDDDLPKQNGYYGMTAQRSALERRGRRRKLVRFTELRSAVIEQLMAGWSPEQIAGRVYTTPANRPIHRTQRGDCLWQRRALALVLTALPMTCAA